MGKLVSLFVFNLLYAMAYYAIIGKKYIVLGVCNMEYITAKEAAEGWGISVRRVQFLCVNNKVLGAARHGKSWAIPKDAPKPDDGRYRSSAQREKNHVGEMKHFIGVLGRAEKELFSFLEYFPYPIQVFLPDGIMAFINDACLELLHIPSSDHVVGRFNVLEDSVIDAWGDNVRSQILGSFQGETVRLDNIKIPIPDIIERFETDELCFDSSFQNITCFPVYDEYNQLKYVVHLFINNRLYNGKEELVKAKEYIENNWAEDFDLEKVAQAVKLSKYHFAHMFKKYTAMTPYSYYQEVKIRKLKEALRDENLSISEAFALCGMDYNGYYASMFRKKVGMTPSQYRKSVSAEL